MSIILIEIKAMAVFDECFYDFPDGMDVHEVDRYLRGVYFHKARQLCKNKNIDIQNISTLEHIVNELDERDSALIATYTDGYVLQIAISTEEEPVELDCVDSLRDDKGEVDYDYITKMVAESYNGDQLSNINAIPNMFIVLTKPEKLSDLSITNENIVEVTLPLIVNDNEDSAFFNITPERHNTGNFSIYRAFPDVSSIISGIISSVYEYNKENGTITSFEDDEEYDEDDFDEQ